LKDLSYAGKYGLINGERRLPDKAEALIPALRSAFPRYSPNHLMAAAETMKGYWIATVLQAERKAAQGSAPVYLYLLAWETPVDNGWLLAHHALDLPLVFDNVENARLRAKNGDIILTLTFPRDGDYYDLSIRQMGLTSSVPEYDDDKEGGGRGIQVSANRFVGT
jgi:hypothetical protein